MIERYVRQDDESWLLTAYSELAATFQFGSLPASILLAEIYRGVEFPASSGR